MKASKELLEEARHRIAPLDTPDRRGYYGRREFPRADRVVDLDRRYRWDLLWASGRWFYDNEEWGTLNNEHIDTMLRACVPPLDQTL